MDFLKNLCRALRRPALREITSCERITLRISGMRSTTEYVVTGGEPAALSLYRISYAGDKEVRTLEKSAALRGAQLPGLLDSCGVARWDGFHGAHPKHVSDGEMFTFTAVVNGGVTIRADGSANFPRGYHEFVRALCDMLQ